MPKTLAINGLSKYQFIKKKCLRLYECKKMVEEQQTQKQRKATKIN